MGRNGDSGLLTLKQISNKIKAKGLQKLRWYCQMCQKQCRDENGFKCHTMSDSHQRQLLLVAENPITYVESFSKEFSDSFLNYLNSRFGTKRVQCNVVYQEYIKDRHHTHMNSTKWENLTDYVTWLGRERHCTVDETDKGWFIQYIDRCPETLIMQNSLRKTKKAEKNQEETEKKWINQMIANGVKNMKKSEKIDSSLYELVRSDDDEKITFKIPKMYNTAPLQVCNALLRASSEQTTEQGKQSEAFFKNCVKKRKISSLEEIVEFEKRKKAKLMAANNNDSWLVTGIVVKIITAKAGSFFINKKVIVEEICDEFKAVLKHMESGKKLLLNQEDLRTVLPAIGKKVHIVRGNDKGEKAILTSIEEAFFSCTIILNTGSNRGKKICGVDYGDVCKII